METETLVKELIGQWEARLSNKALSPEYRCALSECRMELQNIISRNEEAAAYMDSLVDILPPEEMEEYVREQEADLYLSTLEAHEEAA